MGFGKTYQTGPGSRSVVSCNEGILNRKKTHGLYIVVKWHVEYSRTEIPVNLAPC